MLLLRFPFPNRRSRYFQIFAGLLPAEDRATCFQVGTCESQLMDRKSHLSSQQVKIHSQLDQSGRVKIFVNSQFVGLPLLAGRSSETSKFQVKIYLLFVPSNSRVCWNPLTRILKSSRWNLPNVLSEHFWTNFDIKFFCDKICQIFILLWFLS